LTWSMQAGNVLMPDLAVDAAGFDKACLQTALGLAITHEHCSGIFAYALLNARPSVPLRTGCCGRSVALTVASQPPVPRRMVTAVRMMRQRVTARRALGGVRGVLKHAAGLNK
jgi:hypothetical protein